MSKIIELKQDPSLIEKDFNGYKLSIEEIRKTKCSLRSKVGRIPPSEEHYTYKHAKLFGLHNHLIADERGGLYFIGVDRAVYKTEMNAFGDLEKPTAVWKVPLVSPQSDYNLTLGFPSEGFSVVSDGTGWLYIVEAEKCEWKTVHSQTFNFPFVIEGCRFREQTGELHCLLYNVIIEGGCNKSCMHWVTFRLEGKIWALTNSIEMKSKGELYYSGIQNDCSSLLIASEHPFIGDSSKEPKQRSFIWAQNGSSVNVKIKAGSGDFLVRGEEQFLRVSCGDKVVLEGELYGKIDEDLTSWERADGVVDIHLTKVQNDLTWPELLVGNTEGEYVPDKKLTEEVHQRLAHLCSETEVISSDTSILNSEMEECDYPSSNTGVIDRITPAQSVIERAFLGTQSLLFKQRLEPGEMPALAVQQNEDVFLWKPENCGLKHVGTLMAFGYIQASKQRKKFSICAPDLSYSVICESSRHLFIYRQNKTVSSGELRNRVSGKRVQRVAQQQVIDLTDDEILGLHATNTHLFVLTVDCIYALFM